MKFRFARIFLVWYVINTGVTSALYDNIGNVAVAIVITFVYLITAVQLELSKQQTVKSVIFPAVVAIAIAVILNP